MSSKAQPAQAGKAKAQVAHDHSHGEQHISVRTYIIIFVALMVLMAATVGAYLLEQAFHMPEALGIAIAMGIASLKTALIVIYFMHVKLGTGMVKVYAAAGFIWLLILFGITMGDYLARDWPPPAEGPLSSLTSE